MIKGGLIDDRYALHNGQVQVQTDCEHTAGNVHTIPHDLFHEVTWVEPGTMSLMDCDEGIKEDWGYLDPDKGLYTPNKESPIDARFHEAFYALNPHLRK